MSVKSSVEISQNFVALSEYYMNFKNILYEIIAQLMLGAYNCIIIEAI